MRRTCIATLLIACLALAPAWAQQALVVKPLAERRVADLPEPHSGPRFQCFEPNLRVICLTSFVVLAANNKGVIVFSRL